MWSDLYDPWGAKNQGFHNGRNFKGYFLVGYTAARPRMKTHGTPKWIYIKSKLQRK